MFNLRKNTFETNSSSTHSYSISKDDSNWSKLRDIFDEILYDDLPDCCDDEDLAEILKKLNKAQNILI